MKNLNNVTPGVSPTRAPVLLVWRNDYDIPPDERKAYSEEMREIPGFGGRPEAVLAISDGADGGPDAIPEPIRQKIAELGRLFFLFVDHPQPEMPAHAALEDFLPEPASSEDRTFWTVLVWSTPATARAWRRFLETNATGWVAEVDRRGAHIIKPGRTSPAPIAA